MKTSLNLRISAAMLALIFFSILAISAISINELSSSARASVSSTMRQEAQARLNIVDRLLFERVADIESLTTGYNTVMSQGSIGEKLDYLRAFEDRRQVYGSSSIYDLNGIKIADTRGLLVGVDQSMDPFFAPAARGEIYSGTIPVNSRALGVPVLHFSGPLRDANGTITSVVLARFPISKLNELVAAGLDAYDVDLVAPDGLIIFSSKDTDEILKEKFDPQLLQRLAADKGEGVVYTRPGTQEMLYVFATEQGFLDYKGHGWKLILAAPTSQVFSHVNSLELNLVLLSLLILAISVVFGLFISGEISKPLIQLHNATEEVEKGNYSARVDIRTGDEIEDLGNAFNRMIGRLEKVEIEHKQLDNAKTEFMSITSHELRSPITPMRAQLQMLQANYFGKLSRAQADSIDIVLRNTERLDRIIMDFLEISRIEAARLKFTFVKTSLQPHILRLAEEMKGFMPEKKVRIVTRLGKLPAMEVDPDRAMQVLRNLTNNAIKFSPENGIVEISAKQESDYILFGVKDSGTGISIADQQKIFEPFFQAESAMSRKFGGTGLGLAICKGIVLSQKGKIWFESTPGKGTTFHFTIPLKPTRNIEKVVVLFSRRQDVDEKLRALFVDMLGPLGENEFNTLKAQKGISYESLVDYVGGLRAKKILPQRYVWLFAQQIDYILEKSGGKAGGGNSQTLKKQA
ncbi:Methyl sulfide methyltransferase-associated sensor [Candidatus Anstonella stagnisolia]|nr:Methyl sulfide methyltransferase-associated sensor [Candidatus Anstonella stagnisolia]